MSMAETPPPERLRSLDAMRGFDMFWIIGGDALGRALDQWFFDTPDHFAFTATFKEWLKETWARWIGGSPKNIIATQLEHVKWEGFRFYDLIFPLFLFVVGAV